ncbi:MAG: ribosome biogenesis GTPase YlqF [Betaproteobacteria bacterium]|jgi:ribosome biogenesis GTPase A|nr:ribosome biogenesis GTPase YlqF [Betaproteobacteria bacterium]
MTINWFPGHMAVALEKIEKAMADHDLVIEVLDARCPQASANPLVASLRMARQRPVLKLLNKADAADAAVTARWITHFEAQSGVRALAISSKKPGDAARVIAGAKRMAPHRNDPTKPLRMLVMGVPNVGKSTLINALLKQRAAKVGDEPAITKALAHYKLSPELGLTDTPGLLWPKIEDPRHGLILAASHSVGINAYIESEVAEFLAGLLLAQYPKLLAARYGTPADGGGLDGVAMIEAVAVKRGFRVRGGGLDTEKAAVVLLNDFRSGALGRISLEAPPAQS